MTHNSAASKNSNDDSSGTRTPGSPEMNEKSDDRGDRNNDINVESIKEEKVSNMMNSSPMEHQMNKEGKNPRNDEKYQFRSQLHSASEASNFKYVFWRENCYFLKSTKVQISVPKMYFSKQTSLKLVSS